MSHRSHMWWLPPVLVCFVAWLVPAKASLAEPAELTSGAWELAVVADDGRIAIGNPCLVGVPPRESVMMIGGVPLRLNEPSRDMAEWTGEEWAELDEESPFCMGDAAAYEEASGEIVVVHPAWYRTPPMLMSRWNGRKWRTTEIEKIPYRTGHTVEFDPESGDLLLFGGQAPVPIAGEHPCVVPKPTVEFLEPTGYWRDTWRYDGETWTRLDPTCEDSPHPLAPGFMYTDHEEVFLFGAHGVARSGHRRSIAFRWTGTSWDEIPRPPGPRLKLAAGGLLSFDPAHGELIASGTFLSAERNPFKAVRVWNRTDGWRDIDMATNVESLFFAGQVYAPSNGGTLFLETAEGSRRRTRVLRPLPRDSGCCGHVEASPVGLNLEWLLALGFLWMTAVRRRAE